MDEIILVLKNGNSIDGQLESCGCVKTNTILGNRIIRRCAKHTPPTNNNPETCIYCGYKPIDLRDSTEHYNICRHRITNRTKTITTMNNYTR